MNGLSLPLEIFPPDVFPLEIFPQGALAGSVITTVWIGVFVVAFFNLRLGWVLSGLVVPGYLVPLLFVKPWAVAAITLEGVVAYALVWFFSERLSQLGGWSSLFGRDRFFALILASILVRITFDGWLLPQFGAWLEGHGYAFDYRNELHSFGLVIVALVANQFWKTGILRGLPPLIITVGVTWLIVRYGLMELTNFGISNISYMYEDLAASILASPKAYIVLVVTAFVASRMNLHYGWDFNGILLPALLALQWYEPMKIVTSFAEAFIILALGSVVLKLPPFSRHTIEGASKLLLFFNIGFLYKIASGYALLAWAPELKVSDYYAFGYLLSTLLAIKMHDKGIAARLTRATLQTSLVSVAAASLIGLALTLLPSTLPWAEEEAREAPVAARASGVMEALLERKPLIYAGRLRTAPAPLAQEVEHFSEGVRLLARFRAGGDEAALREGAALLDRVGYRVERLGEGAEGRHLYISERPPERGWGSYLIDSGVGSAGEGGLVVEVPQPLEGRGLVEGGGALYTTLGARALAIAGAAGAGRDPQGLFHAFHRVMGRRDTLQLRAYTAESARELAGARRAVGGVGLPRVESGLWVKGRLPPSLDLARLKGLSGGFNVTWGETPFTNVERNASREGFSELFLNRAGLRRLLFAPLLARHAVALREEQQRIDGFLQQWLLDGKARIAAKGSDAYRPPAAEELLYLDEEVITPMLALAEREYRPFEGGGTWSEEGREELRALNAAAGVLGYGVTQYRHRGTGSDYLILEEREGSDPRHWGTYVLRLGPARPYLVQVPRPLFEVNSFEFAVALFERLEGRALLIGGAHPAANRDRSADLIRYANMANLFNLFNQVVLRESGAEPLLALQCRAFGQRPGEPLPDGDILLSLDDGSVAREQLDAPARSLLDTLEGDGWQLRFVDGAPELTGYQVGGLPQSRYLEASENDRFALLWVSPLARSAFRRQGDERALAAQFAALDIPRREGGLAARIAEGARAASDGLDPEVRAALARYLGSRDILALAAVTRRGLAAERFIDIHTRQSFLLLSGADGALRLVANLTPRGLSDEVRVNAHAPDAAALNAQVERYLESRAPWLLFEGEG